MNRSTFWMIKYMNGSVFSKARYMNRVGFEILARTPVPKLPLLPFPPPPAPPPPPHPHREINIIERRYPGNVTITKHNPPSHQKKARWHYENMPIQMYWNFNTKIWKFSDKKFWYFHISALKIDCVYSLEPPQRGGSNEYPQSMFFEQK